MSNKYYIQHDDGTLEETDPPEYVKKLFADIERRSIEVCKNCCWRDKDGTCFKDDIFMEEYGTCDEWEGKEE